MFYSGQRVVCVNTAATSDGRQVTGITEGETYTVRWCGTYKHPLDGMHLCLRLFGVTRNGWTPDMPFLATRFRPVSDRPTSIEIFKSLLNPSPETVALGEGA